MKIISGGQTGVDRAALDAAIDRGLPHGGWCPRGRRAEDGRIPDRYRLGELPSADYATRTERNVLDAEATLIVTRGKPRGGTALTVQFARRHSKPLLLIEPDEPQAAERVAAWLREHSIDVLNVAGPRESQSPGIGAATKRVLWEALTVYAVE